MKLFYASGACSLGIHLLLEERGQPYQTQALDLLGGEQRQPAFATRNPKSKVPALERDDGSILTEYGAISRYLADATPLGLDHPEAQARGTEMLDFIVGTIHGEGFRRVFRPANYTPTAADHDWVKQRGRDIATQAFAVVATTLADRDFLFGPLSHVDCALFYVEFWSRRAAIELPPNLAAHLARLRARPAAHTVLAREGLA